VIATHPDGVIEAKGASCLRDVMGEETHWGYPVLLHVALSGQRDGNLEPPKRYLCAEYLPNWFGLEGSRAGRLTGL
jgi:hypothetical protein